MFVDSRVGPRTSTPYKEFIMNASGFVAMAVEKNERQYVLNIPFGSPYEDAIDACLDIIADIKQMKKDSDAKTAEQKAEVEAAAKPVEAELVS
jgi:hypothetical protein